MLYQHAGLDVVSEAWLEEGRTSFGRPTYTPRLNLALSLSLARSLSLSRSLARALSLSLSLSLAFSLALALSLSAGEEGEAHNLVRDEEQA